MNKMLLLLKAYKIKNIHTLISTAQIIMAVYHKHKHSCFVNADDKV